MPDKLEHPKDIGMCPHGNFPDTCPMCKEKQEIGTGKFDVEESVSDDDRRKFFELFYRVYQSEMGEDEAQIKRRAELTLKYFNRPSSPLDAGAERHVFIIRDRQNVVAGGELFIGQKESRKEAYLGHKVVDERYRGQELARLLVTKRLGIARSAGCREAWSIVEGNNVAALRSITKNGFVIKGNGVVKTGNEMVRDSYYVSYDLENIPPEPLPLEKIERAPIVQITDQLVDELILISLEDRTLIEQAFTNGYEGVRIVLPKDMKQIERPMMLLKKAHTESGADEN